MGQKSETCMIGLEMANCASSHGMQQVLQTVIPVVNPETKAGQLTVVWSDQNYYERGLYDTITSLWLIL